MADENDAPVIEEEVAAPVVEEVAITEVAPAAEVTPPATPPEPPKWAMARIHEETNRRLEVERQRQATEAENRNLKEILARLQKGDGTAPVVPKPADQPGGDRYAQDVQAEAARIAFERDTVVVRDAGLAAFPNFGESLRTLQAVGVIDNECVADIIATAGRDQAHVLLDQLARDPEKAASIAQLDSRSRVSQLTRMLMAETSTPKPASGAAAPAAKPAAISKAPPPKPRIDPGTSVPSEDRWMDDKASDEEFFAGFKKKYSV